jgi:hypothetical protein
MPNYYDGPTPMNTTALGLNGIGQNNTDNIRMPEVVAESQELTADLEHVGKLVAELEQRFVGVLRPPSPQAEGAETQTPDPSSPMAIDLRQKRLRARYIAQHLQQILSRCECG